MSSRYVMDFAIEYIVMYVSTMFLNNFTLNILFVNSWYLNGKYVIVLKISADAIQGHEDSKWLFVMDLRCTSFFDISNPKEYFFFQNDPAKPFIFFNVTTSFSFVIKLTPLYSLMWQLRFPL